MATQTRAELVDLITAKILTGGRRTTAAKVREAVTALVESLSNIEDDANANGGYMALDTSGRADVTKINSATPEGKVLSDYGTFINQAYKPLFRNYVDESNSTNTETDIYLRTIAAGTLSDNGDTLKLKYSGKIKTSATDTRRVRFYFAGTAIFDSGANTYAGGDTVFLLDATIVRTSPTRVRYQVSMAFNNGLATGLEASGELTGITLSNTNDVKMTFQNAASISNEMTAYFGEVDKISAP